METNLPRLLARAALTGCLVGGVISALAQPVAPGGPASGAVAPAAEVVELSPFVVSAEDNVGYVATSSLGGGRIKTEYRDIASQVSVMTPEFLADINAFDVDDAYLYSANVENSAESAATATNFFGGSGLGVAGGNRVRGLGSSTPTRNFFGTSIPASFYNSGDGGLTLASGPNAILFGLGTAGGISDSRLNSANLTTRRGQIRLNADSFGTFRTSLDFNQPLIKDRLALRVDLLDSAKRFALEPAREDDERAYATLKFKPISRLTMEISAEYMDRLAHRPVYVMPKDAVTPWVNPGMGNSTPFNTPDTSPLGLATNPASNGYLVNWAANAQDQTAPTYTVGANIDPGLYFYRYTGTVRNLGEVLQSGYGATSVPNNPLFASQGFSGDMTLQSDALYPVKDRMHYGLTHPAKARAQSMMSINTLRVTDDLHLEAAAYWESYREANANLLFNVNANLLVDPNAYRYNPGYIPLNPLATGTTGTANRAANAANRTATNPTQGLLYVQGQGQNVERINSSREFRLSAAYRFDPAKRFGSNLGRWVGSQNLFTNVSFLDSRFMQQEFRRRILDTGVNPATGLGIAPKVITAANARDVAAGNNRYMVNANRGLTVRYYLDPTNPAHASASYGGLDPWSAWTFDDVGGGTFQTDNVPEFGASGNRTQDLSRAFSWQGYFLDRRLVLTYAKRWDTVTSKQPFADAASERTGLFRHYEDLPWLPFVELPTFVNDTKSAVLHPLNWFSVFYSESTNNQASAPVNHDITGLLHPVSTGEGKDYGVSFQWKGLQLRINRYETAQTSTDAGNQFGLARGGPQEMEARYINLQRNRVLARGLSPFDDFYLKTTTQPGFNPADNTRAYYRIFADSLATGTEFELSGRVGKLDVRVAVGRQKSIKTDVGPRWINYITDPAMIQRMENLEYYLFDTASSSYLPVVGFSGDTPVFGAPGATPLKGWDNIRYADGNAETIKQRWQRLYLPSSLTAAAFEGVSNPRVRAWRANATVAYNVSKAWRLGTSIRMRDPQLLSYYDEQVPVTDPAGKPVLDSATGQQLVAAVADLTRPVFNNREFYYDPFVSYRGSFRNGMKYTVQLNINNLLGTDDLVMIDTSSSDRNRVNLADPKIAYYDWTDSTSIPMSYQIQDPRSYSLTFTLNF